MQLNELKSDHYSLVRENKEQSEKLNKELQNNINAQLLKNILVGYLTTNDPSVSKDCFDNKGLGAVESDKGNSEGHEVH